MKVGAEVHFLSGQVFMAGVAAVAILPRVPSDIIHDSRIGGRLSLPFRRALLWLIGIGIVRTLACHLLAYDDQNVSDFSNESPHNSNSSAPSKILTIVDAALAAIQVTGQSFLCLTTAYILQCQMEHVINIEGGSPGRSLRPYLLAILVLAVSGSLLSAFVHPYWFCLVNLAEAISCRPVVKTLQTYASLTTVNDSATSSRHDRRPRKSQGPILAQALLIVEYWFLTTSLLSVIAEIIAMTESTSIDGFPRDSTVDHPGGMLDVKSAILEHGQATIRLTTNGMVLAVKLLLDAIRSNQDNGIDDWTRLLLHSVFLNSMDELMHFSGGISSSTNGGTNGGTRGDHPHEYEQEQETVGTQPNSTTMVMAPSNNLRQRVG